jgi:hypothetical protein
MNRISAATIIVLGVLLTPGVAHAQRPVQERERDRVEVPRRYQPPAGMCRIWVNGVPPAKQPAPTDCTRALRERPANGRVVFGENLPRPRTAPSNRGGRQPD